MKKLMTSIMVLVLSYSMAEAAVQTPVEKGDVKQSFSDTMKYAARGFKSCTDTCIVGKDSYKKVCENKATKEWCKKNCEHKKFIMDGKEKRFNVEAKCKMTMNKAGEKLVDMVDEAGKHFEAAAEQFMDFFSGSEKKK